jgi:hypothetical protein
MFEQILSKVEKHLTAEVLFAMTLVSVIMIVASVLALPPILCRLPPDYFDHEKPHLLQRIRSAAPGKAVMLVAKNFAGVILVAAGILMLFLPGQGMLTILIGIILTDFPGKYRIERNIASNPKILAAINWLRKKHGRPDMIITKH